MTADPAVVMTIGGSDSGAGAGVQADLKTLSAHGVYAVTAVTAVTAQNTRGVEAVHPVPADMIAAQIEVLLADLPPAAAKTGMLGRAETVRLVARCAPRIPNLVVDPVLVDRNGELLADEAADEAAVEAYREYLIPAAALATPNHREAALLAGRPVRTRAEQEAAARDLALAAGTPILVTGGRIGGPRPVDVLSYGEVTRSFAGRWVRSDNLHGTGDALSASIAARLAGGAGLLTAVGEAKAWVSRAIAGAAEWQLGRGEGPIDHFGWA